MLTRSGITLIKYWFSVSDEEQEKRFKERINTPSSAGSSAPWTCNPAPLGGYSRAKDDMFTYTDTEDCPWFVVDADDKRRARLNCIAHLLGKVPYEAIHYEPIILPPSRPRAMSARPDQPDLRARHHRRSRSLNPAGSITETTGNKKPVFRPAKGIEY